MSTTFDPSFIWAALILIGVTIYIITDGFDLGIGILLPFLKDETEQDQFIDSIAPIWDGNETWLVLGGAALMGAFPLAYAVILEAFTIPVVIMLFALILRGVAFEFRVHSNHKLLWTRAFIIGSWVASFMQGAMAGAFLQGFDMNGQKFIGTDMDWLTPFSMLTGFGLVIAFALIGNYWGMMKCQTSIRNHLAKLSQPILLALVIALTLIAILMRYSSNISYDLDNGRKIIIAACFILILVIAIILFATKIKDMTKFLLTLGIVCLGMIGFMTMFFPYIIPPSLTLSDAASSGASQMFSLVGTLIMLPIILLYLSWTYYVFRGKVSSEGHY